jgi:hypothetical protein
VLLLVTGWVEPTFLGEVFVLAQAAVVALLAELEFIAAADEDYSTDRGGSAICSP